MTVSVTYTFSSGSLASAAEVNANFDDLVDYVNDNMVLKDGTVAFTGVPSGPSTTPSSSNHLTRKGYVDGVRGPKILDLNADAVSVSLAIADSAYSELTNLTASVNVTAGHYYRCGFYLPNIYTTTGTGQMFARLSAGGFTVASLHHYQGTAGQGQSLYGEYTAYTAAALTGHVFKVEIAQTTGGLATLKVDTDGAANIMRLWVEDLGAL